MKIVSTWCKNEEWWFLVSLTAAESSPSADTFQPWFHFSAGGPWIGSRPGSYRSLGLRSRVPAPDVFLGRHKAKGLAERWSTVNHKVRILRCFKNVFSATDVPSSSFLDFSSFSNLAMKRSRSSSTTARVVWICTEKNHTYYILM